VGQPTVVDFQLAETVLSLEGLRVSGSVDPVAGVKAPYSIARLDKQNLATVPTTQSALTSIQGKIAGAQIVRNTGQPGTGVSIVLRTPSSISGSTSPLFVVDGVVLADIGGTTLDIEALDMENVEVIKGAAAASLYGSRAAGGVISITTSRGRNLALDQTRIRVRTEIGKSNLQRYDRLADVHPYAVAPDGVNWLDSGGNPTPRYSQRTIDTDRLMDNPWPGQVFDNVGALMRPGLFTTTAAEMAFSSTSTNFLVSLNRYLERGALEGNDGYERGNIRVNLDHRLRDDFSLSVSAYHNRSINDIYSGDPFYTILQMPPNVDLAKKDENGNYLWKPDSTINIENPLWRQNTRTNLDRRSRTLLSGDARFNPTGWLTILGNVSYDRSDLFDERYLPKGTYTDANEDPDGDPSDGSLEYNSDITDAINASVNLSTLHTFGDLTARLTGRALMEREKSTGFNAQGDNLVVRDVPDLTVASDPDVSSGLTEIRSNGYSLAAGFDYAGKYIADLLVRRDGSSLFGSNERWQTYGRVALAYRMAQESWWPLRAFTEFKPRFAIGTAGGRPTFTAQYETWNVDGSTGQVSKNTLGNPNLKPEFTVEREIGLDMILANKYQIELTYAKQKTTDNIIQMTTAGLTGYGTQWQNSGTIEGTTYEATFQAQLANQRNFSWNTTLVWDRSRSEITEWERACIGASNTLGEICKGRTRGQMLGYSFLRSVSELPDYLKGRENEFDVNDDGYVVWVGAGNTYRDGWSKNLWGTQTSIEGYPVPVRWGHPLVKQNELGFLDSKTEIGHSNPDFQLGWLNNINWRGFAIHTHFHAQIGGETYNNTRRALYTIYRHKDLDQRGKPQEMQKPVDYYSAGLASGTWFVNKEFVEDATYLKLRAVSVQYRFNRDQLAKVGLDRLTENLSLGINGRNLFTITPYTGMDPEVGGVFFRVDQWYYPPPRTITMIAEITF
jgi:TonB-linked SusC/RagA family outer membrane protein